MGATESAMSAARGFVSLELFPLANNKQIQSLTLLFASNPTTTTSNKHSPPRPPLYHPPTPSTSAITPSSTNTLIEPPSSSPQPIHVWVSSAKCYIQREQALTKLLACAPDRHAERTEKLLQTHKSGLKEIKSLQSKLASLVTTGLIAQSQQQRRHHHDRTIVPVVCYHSPDGDLAFLQAILKQLGGAKEQAVFVLVASGTDTSGGAFLLAGPEQFVMQHSRDAVRMIDGKGGGGKNGIFQGNARRLSELRSLIDKLEELLLAEPSA